MSSTRTGAHRPNQHERAQRRAVIEELLRRLLAGGTLTIPEAAVMADYWRQEQRAADATRKSLYDTNAALTRHREAADDAIREAEDERDRQHDRAEQAIRRAVEEYDHRQAAEQRCERAEGNVSRWRDRAEVAEQRTAEAERAVEDYRGALSHALGLGTSAPWDAIHARAAELHTTAQQPAAVTAAAIDKYADQLDCYRQRAEQAERQVGILYAVDEGRASGAQRIMNERDQAQQRTKSAETELRTLRAGLRANGADPTQIQNLWAQISLRNRQWREEKQRAENFQGRARAYEQRALDAEEQLTAYRSVLGPRPLDTIHAAQQRAKEAEQCLARLRDMADAWERRLPATIRTATAAEAVRRAANGDDRPVMFSVTAAKADDDQAVKQRADCTPAEWAEQERARLERLYTRESARADKAQRRGDIWKAKAQEIEADRDRYRERAKQAEADRDKAIAAFNKVTLELWEAAPALNRVRTELDRVAQLGTVTVDNGRADSFAVGARWTLRMIREALDGRTAEPEPTPADPCRRHPMCPCNTCLPARP